MLLLILNREGRLGKNYFIIEIQIIRGFDHISGDQFTTKHQNIHEHSKYKEILILIEQHPNCRLPCAASPVT